MEPLWMLYLDSSRDGLPVGEQVAEPTLHNAVNEACRMALRALSTVRCPPSGVTAVPSVSLMQAARPHTPHAKRV